MGCCVISCVTCRRAWVDSVWVHGTIMETQYSERTYSQTARSTDTFVSAHCSVLGVKKVV